MSSGPVRRVLPKDIQLVQNLIERCLQLYMNQKEVVETLLAQAKIEPGFTELVWQKLEKENQDFFRAYYMRLMVKHQIIKFNKLLEHQVRLMQHQIQPAGVASMPTSNGSHIPQLHHNSALYATERAGPSLKQENVQHDIGSRLPNAFTNGGSSLHTNMHDVIDMSAHASRIDVPHNLLPIQSSNIGLIQGLNGGMIENETGYYGSSPYMFDADGHVLEARPPIGDTSVASFSSVGSSTRSLNETLLNADSASFGYFDQIPRIFSFSDLTADFSQSADILESYSRSPFLAANTENFLDSREGEHQGDNKRLDTISEGLSYEDFGSD